MAAPIVPDLLELMPDTIEAQPGTPNEYGDFVESGAALALPCHIEGSAKLVRDPLTGREVISSFQAYVGGHNDLTVEGHRYTLPDRFVPSGALTAIAVEKADDENGPHAEVVILP